MAARVHIRLLRIVLGFVCLSSLTLAVNFHTQRAAVQKPPATALDILIIIGKLVDGSGKGPRKADVGIRGDRIVFVGDARKTKLEAARTIDATGMIVAPGFIDGHTHTLADLTNEQTKSNQAYLMQGVTTVVTGNDGGSVLNVGDMLRKWETQGIGTNAVLLAGFGTIRGTVLGPTDAQPNAAQLEEMKHYVARAMDSSRPSLANSYLISASP